MSDGRQRLSGSQYRKRKAEKEADLKKQSGSLKKYFECPSKNTLKHSDIINQQSNIISTNDSNKLIDVAIHSSSSTLPYPAKAKQIIQTNKAIIKNDLHHINDFEKIVATEKEIDTCSTTISPTFDTVKVQDEQLAISTDPANWPFLNDNLKIMIVKRGPPPPLDDNFVFPLDEDNRRFTTFSYKRYLTNGECLLRTWLVFSISKNKVFCFYCKLFASSKIKLASDGYNDWRHIGRTLKEHETSNTHLNSYKTYIELVI